MTSLVTKEDVLSYHKATGCPLARASAVLAAMEPLLRERVLLASQQFQSSRGLRDPLEFAPETSALIESARAEATERARASGRIGRGSCHFIWQEQARILYERYNFVWFSPKAMNPDVVYD
ncbi:hypothetical protein LL974_09470 [Xanthomonas campestris pv. cannae]|nr:hypothetical protein [Xanthomonas campestris pv. cannae]